MAQRSHTYADGKFQGRVPQRNLQDPGQAGSDSHARAEGDFRCAKNGEGHRESWSEGGAEFAGVECVKEVINVGISATNF